jgi:hypothetical protein
MLITNDQKTLTYLAALFISLVSIERVKVLGAHPINKPPAKNASEHKKYVFYLRSFIDLNAAIALMYHPLNKCIDNLRNQALKLLRKRHKQGGIK